MEDETIETGGGGAPMNFDFGQSPFGRLLDLPGIDGPEDIFGSLGGDGGSNPFAGSDGNPLAGGGSGNPFSRFDPSSFGSTADGSQAEPAEPSLDDRTRDDERENGGDYRYDFDGLQGGDDGGRAAFDAGSSDDGTENAARESDRDGAEPELDIGTSDDGNVIFAEAGDSVTVGGGNNKFVIEVNGQPREGENTSVVVEGGNNQFVIVFNYDADGGTERMPPEGAGAPDGFDVPGGSGYVGSDPNFDIA